jgi:prolipoprotein diacylglyceryl transferase
MIILRAYASIWDFFNVITGSNKISEPPQTYGTMMAIAFVVGVYIAYIELKRREKLGIFAVEKRTITIGAAPSIGDILPSAIFGFIIGYKLVGRFVDFAIYSQSPMDYIMSSKGSLMGGLLMFIVVAGYLYFEKKKKQLASPQQKEVDFHIYDRLGDILLMAMVGGVLGSKILDAIDNPASMQELIKNPFVSLTSGLSILGGLWLASILMIIYSRRNKIPLLHFLDSLAPAFLLAYAVGRLGCQFSGDGCWGISSVGFSKPSWVPDFLWGNTYAHNVNNDGIPIPNCLESYCYVLKEPHFPTPLYETLLVSICFLILWNIRKRYTHFGGAITGIFLILNGLERFVIEFIRVNTRYTFLNIELSQAQYISFVMIVLGMFICYWSVHKQKAFQS